MPHQNTVSLFIDEESTPIGEYKMPINFELDTTKITDGEHVLKIVSKSLLGKEGIRKIPFTVKTGRSISIEGTNELILFYSVKFLYQPKKNHTNHIKYSFLTEQ
jgi:hypothetical protein